jgi:hypothetical protein
VDPVLSILGDPASITVGIDAGTLFFLEQDEIVAESALAVGQTVEIKFATFTAEPFPAFKVEIETSMRPSRAPSPTSPACPRPSSCTSRTAIRRCSPGSSPRPSPT